MTVTDPNLPPEDEVVYDDDADFESLGAGEAVAEQLPTPKTLADQPMFQILFAQSIDPNDDENGVLSDFAEYIVGPLSYYFGMKAAKGGAFFRLKEQEGASNTERYSRDQTLRAHLINGMLPARRIARLLHQWDAQPMRDWDETVERLFIAGYMLHDFLKIPEAQATLRQAGFETYFAMSAPSEQQIPTLEQIFLEWGENLGLDAFLQPVGGLERLLHDVIYIACNTQRLSGTAHAPALLPKTAMPPSAYKLAANVSTLADLLAYIARTPRDLVAHPSVDDALKRLSVNTSPTIFRVAKLVYHHVAENRGLLLNFIHDAVLEVLTTEGRVPLLFAPSGVVYLERHDAGNMPAPEVLIPHIVQQINYKVAKGLVEKKKAVKLGKDGLRTDDVYKDVLDLRQFVAVSTSLTGLIRSNAPQYLEKLVTLGYPHTDALPQFSSPTDTRLRQMAEWASLLEIQYEERAPALTEGFHRQVLALWEIEDLARQFEESRTYKPVQREGTGIRYHWYWAAAHALARKPGISPNQVWEWLDYASNEIASALPQDLPESALPNQEIWEALADYVARVLTLGGAKTTVPTTTNELERYARAKAGRGGAVCAICGSAYNTRKPAETAVAFQPGVYTGRIKIGASDNKRNLCSICALEQLLRQLFMSNLDSGGTAEGQRVRYLSFYPSYFFTSETMRFMRRVYGLLKDVRLSDKELRRALNEQASLLNGAQHPLMDASFWQRLEPFLLRALDEEPSKRVVRYGAEAQSTFLMVGFRNFNDPSDTESWVLPAILALALPVCLDVKVVASEGGVPLLLEANELPETVWFDGAHAAIQTLVGGNRLRIDDLEDHPAMMTSLARLTAAYLIHLDAEYEPPKENWHRLPPIAHSLMESPLYVFHYLKKQERDDRPLSAEQVRRYIAYAERLFNEQGDKLMSHARKLVELYRGFYRAKNIGNANSILRPLSVVSDALLVADPRLFGDATALVEVAYGELYRFMDRVSKGLADGRFPKGVSVPQREQAMRTFCEAFVNDVFIGVFNQDVAALRGKQLNLLRSACEVLYRDMQRAEWDGSDPDEPDDEPEA